jgi:hypothetical protein
LTRHKKKNQEKVKSYVPIIVFIIATVILSLIYDSIMNDLNISSEDFEINSPETTQIVTAIAIGTVMGGSLAGISMIYRGYEITGKTYVWVVGIIYPGIVALVSWLLTFMASTSSLTYKLFFIGNIVGLVVSIIIVGIGITIGDFL